MFSKTKVKPEFQIHEENLSAQKKWIVNPIIEISYHKW